MHKVYENNDLLMYFKKRYCHCCGKALLRRKTERIVRQGDPNHRKYCTIGRSYRPYGDILVIGKEFFCSSCNKWFSCEKQGEIIDAQKYYHKHIITNDEITYVKQQKLLIASNRILKMRWILLIPLIGSLICNFAIFNGCLQQKTEDKDLYKLILSSIAFLFGAELISGFALMFINIDIVENYKTTIMMILSLLAFNLPTLWYINHTFKRK